MYANVDWLCCRLSSHANKRGRFVTEQAANTERIKASADAGSRGHQFAGAGLQNSSADATVKTIFHQAELSPRRKVEKKQGLISAGTSARPAAHQVKHGRL